MAEKVIRILDVDEARQEALPCLCDPGSSASWSPEFFRDAFGRILALCCAPSIVADLPETIPLR